MEKQGKTLGPEGREVWIDWMRVAACLMVMTVHATEPFYLGGEGALILSRTDAFWSAFFDSLVRCCVPLFLVASSFLQFPLHYPTGEFLRRRAVRILIPFAVWTLVYALAWGQPVQNLKDLLLNFNYAAGHLWFVYMLVGIYLLMPLLSPWAEKVGRKELLAYLEAYKHADTVEMRLNTLRQQIDAIDERLIRAMGDRMAISRKIAHLKMADHLNAYQPQRWNELLRQRLTTAQSVGLDPHFVRTLYETIHEESIRTQEEIMGGE